MHAPGYPQNEVALIARGWSAPPGECVGRNAVVLQVRVGLGLNETRKWDPSVQTVDVAVSPLLSLWVSRVWEPGRISEDLFYAQDELVAFAQVLGADLVVGVNKEEPFAAIHDRAGTDSTDLLARVGKGDAVRVSVSDLLQVVAVGPNVDIFDDLIRGGRVEVDGLAGLGGAGVFTERRCVVGAVPEIVDAPASLKVPGGIERDCVVGMDVPDIVADVDGAVGRVAAGWGIHIEHDPLIDRHAKEAVLGPLEDVFASSGCFARTSLRITTVSMIGKIPVRL